ncbi:MAG: hypothetical protein ACRYGK_08550 [Janthinobacterium lividum]
MWLEQGWAILDHEDFLEPLICNSSMHLQHLAQQIFDRPGALFGIGVPTRLLELRTQQGSHFARCGNRLQTGRQRPVDIASERRKQILCISRVTAASMKMKNKRRQRAHHLTLHIHIHALPGMAKRL